MGGFHYSANLVHNISRSCDEKRIRSTFLQTIENKGRTRQWVVVYWAFTILHFLMDLICDNTKVIQIWWRHCRKNHVFCSQTKQRLFRERCLSIVVDVSSCLLRYQRFCKQWFQTIDALIDLRMLLSFTFDHSQRQLNDLLWDYEIFWYFVD